MKRRSTSLVLHVHHIAYEEAVYFFAVVDIKSPARLPLLCDDVRFTPTFLHPEEHVSFGFAVVKRCSKHHIPNTVRGFLMLSIQTIEFHQASHNGH